MVDYDPSGLKDRAIKTLIQVNKASGEAASEIQGLLDLVSRTIYPPLLNLSFINCVLVWSQRPNSSVVLEMDTWHGYGRMVTEPGIEVLKRRPLPFKLGKATPLRRENGIYEAYLVWDITQTMGSDFVFSRPSLKGRDEAILDSPIKDINSIIRGTSYSRSRELHAVSRSYRPVAGIYDAAYTLLHGKSVRVSEIGKLEARAATYIVGSYLGLRSTYLYLPISLFSLETEQTIASMDDVVLASTLLVQGLHYVCDPNILGSVE